MIEPCACGTAIVAETGESWMIAAAVRDHNRTAAHQYWRRNKQKVVATAIRRHRTRRAIHDTRLVKALLRETVGIK